MSTTVEATEGGGAGWPVAALSWLPLESNPDALNPFCRKMGLPADWGFAVAYGLDPELLMMAPQPCVALYLLFLPSTNISKPRREDLRG